MMLAIVESAISPQRTFIDYEFPTQFIPGLFGTLPVQVRRLTSLSDTKEVESVAKAVEDLLQMARDRDLRTVDTMFRRVVRGGEGYLRVKAPGGGKLLIPMEELSVFMDRVQDTHFLWAKSNENLARGILAGDFDRAFKEAHSLEPEAEGNSSIMVKGKLLCDNHVIVVPATFLFVDQGCFELNGLIRHLKHKCGQDLSTIPAVVECSHCPGLVEEDYLSLGDEDELDTPPATP